MVCHNACSYLVFFFKDTATPDIYTYCHTLSLHDALPISRHEDGRSAIREMARQIVDIENLTDYERGITANVGLITGGTGINVVPQHCSAELDMRVPDAAHADEGVGKILGLKTNDPAVQMGDRQDGGEGERV